MIKNIKSKLIISFENFPRASKGYIFSFFDSHAVHYPSPASLSYSWSFGWLAGVCLLSQMVTGIFLAINYSPNINLAFKSVEYIMKDVPNGWLIRYVHANGASMFFISVYFHICRGLYYGSYMEPREALWCSGVLLFLAMMATAFTGYVLPWGQMGFWGATVITSMVTAIPRAGKLIVEWIWGGYTIGNPTLLRIYIVHFLLPFVIAGLTLLHLALLHKLGSSNPIGSDTGADDIVFYPNFISKDMFAFTCLLVVFAFFVIYSPNKLNHPYNCIPADPYETPSRVVPEWYFIPFYAILRSIPHKAGGIIAMGSSVLVLLIIPFINSSSIRNTTYRPIFKFCFWAFIIDFAFLLWVGKKRVKKTFVYAGQVATVYYFIFFFILIPLISRIELVLVTYNDLSDNSRFN
jgi:ubiquinol-cytochrome c reductase cytochrome b subunit